MIQEYLGYCLAVPAFVALIGLLVTSRLPAKAQPIAAAGVFFVACLLGGFLLLGKQIHQPERHWHWMPAIALWSWLAGVIGFRPGSPWLERLLWAASCGGLAGWLLVPTWKDLADQRVYLMVGLAVAITALVMVVDRLERLNRPLLLLFSFAVAALVGAVWIGVGFSLTNTRWLLITAATIGGAILAGWLPVARARLEPGRLLPLLCCWLLGGLFIGAIEPNPPRYEILLLALLPVALLASAVGLRSVLQRADSEVPEARM